jgi:hypothetical protein
MSIDPESSLHSQSRNLGEHIITVLVILSLFDQFIHVRRFVKLRHSNFMWLDINSLRLRVMLSVHLKLPCVFNLLELLTLLYQHLLVLLIFSKSISIVKHRMKMVSKDLLLTYYVMLIHLLSSLEQTLLYFFETCHSCD